MGSVSSLEKYMNEKIFTPPKCNVKNLDHYNTSFSTVYGTNLGNSYVNFVVILPEGRKIISKYIVFAHGTGDDITNTFEFGKYMANQLQVGFVIFDYPGYGCSTGQPSEQGCYQSIDNVMFYLTALLKINEPNLVLMGYSLGTGVVVDYAVRHNWSQPLILCAPYKSMISVIHDNILTRPVDKFVTISKINKLKCPIKIFHGETDTLINMSHSKELYENVSNKQFKPTYLPNIGHELMGHIPLNELKEVVFSN